MPAETAIALALFALVLGVGLSWWHFREDLHRLETQLEDAEAEIDRLLEDKRDLEFRALDAEANLELVLAEGEQSPLTAPLQVIRGGGL